MIKNLIMVLETEDELCVSKDKLEGSLERIMEKSKMYHFSIIDIAVNEPYGKTLDLVKNTARERGCDAVHIRDVQYNVGLVAVTTTIEADLYRTK